ncbi:TRAP transporter substrate-binding protein DctP [uncultured Jatrophihabitans sp.]|uniref:TRAP transporter substrate-binding protein DctP n=1 Tax=uncultured Jatrophihabitans sp. TaxID=1610747 RepID=UPI0035CAB699
MKMTVLIAAGAAVAITLAGCGAVTKTGTPAPSVTVLRIGAADPVDPELAYFVQAVDRISQHRIRVDVDKTTYYTDIPGAEAKLAGDVRSGKVPLAYVPSRDWAAVGDPDVEAMQAPFAVTTTEATDQLANGPIGRKVLADLAHYGTVGLALVPDEVRRLLTREPILSVDDLKGLRIRINASDQTARLISALGATPVPGLTSGQTGSGLDQNTLDGVETSPSYISHNHYAGAAPYLTSFGLFPKVQLLMANSAVWAKLSTADRRALTAAAADARTHALSDVQAQEQTELTNLCRTGAVIVRPSAAALQAIATRAASATPQDAAGRKAASQISTQINGAGVEPMAISVPADCQVATTAAQARAIHKAPSAKTSTPAGSAFPTGTFVVTVTAEEFAAQGLTGRDWSQTVTFTWTFTGDGKMKQTQKPDYPDQGVAIGTWKAQGDELTLIYTIGTDPTVYNEVTRWSYYKGVLRFTIVSVQDQGSMAIYAYPWRKVS